MEPTEDHVKIDSIKININGLVVELKVEQARSLWHQLNDLFGPVPAAPVWIWPTYPSYPLQPSYIGDPPYPSGSTCGGVMVNPNAEPFPDHWGVGYNAYTGSYLEINVK